MTHKEKSEELVAKFGKELALKIVEELLENLINSNLNYLNTIKHYQQLKQEITTFKSE